MPYKKLKKVEPYPCTLSDKKEFFHSKFELECWNMIKEVIPETMVSRQKQYGVGKMSVDFYFPLAKIWLEVSTYDLVRKKGYTRKLFYKKRIVEKEIGENFCFVNNMKQMKFFLFCVGSFYTNNGK